jgi:hypothetical protein
MLNFNIIFLFFFIIFPKIYSKTKTKYFIFFLKLNTFLSFVTFFLNLKLKSNQIINFNLKLLEIYFTDDIQFYSNLESKIQHLNQKIIHNCSSKNLAYGKISQFPLLL